MRAATTLAGAGLDVTIVDIAEDPSQPERECLDSVRIQHVILPGFSVPTRFKPWLLVKMFHSLILRTAALLRSDADVYHAIEWEATPACLLAGKIRRKPVIYEAYDLPFDNSPRYFGSTLPRRMYRTLYKRLLALLVPTFAGVIAAAPFYAHEIQLRYGGEAPIVVRNIPPYRPSKATDNLRRYLGLDPATRIALFQGNLHESRSLDVLVHAAKLLPPSIVIVLMGKGPSEEPLRQLVRQEGLEARVRFVPHMPNDELLEWTASADLGLNLLSSAYSLNLVGTLPNKVFEYLMAGLPILNSLPEVAVLLEKYDVGQSIPSPEPDMIARTMTAMLADRQGMERMRQHALSACMHELRWDVEQQGLLALYERVLGVALEHLAAPAFATAQ